MGQFSSSTSELWETIPLSLKACGGSGKEVWHVLVCVLFPYDTAPKAIDMDAEVDHYVILGLPSGEEGAKLSDKEISKAYRSKALELHPDKRLDDPNAHANFQKLKTSYEILKDEKARKLFDNLLRVKRVKLQQQSKQNFKHQKLRSDLEERERAAFAPDLTTKARDEEETIARKLKEEIARIRAMHANKARSAILQLTTMQCPE
ncbi:hypothetical protein RJ639_003976 [Escallonia herrerae]|uniref:J domain-containing protein n=1 Tax=Escallonia herrerae TaxID=1293975 RepID=A0AA88VZJ1_9ASTE|nr:hypothetical protein RJ639_003976 [Escallonia herrerae]